MNTCENVKNILVIGFRFTASDAVTDRGFVPFEVLTGRSVKARGEAQRNPVMCVVLIIKVKPA